jgi:hypothetical protein
VILGFQAGVKSGEAAGRGEVLTAPGFATLTPRARYDATQALGRTLRIMLADRREMVTALYEGKSEAPLPSSEEEEESQEGGHQTMFAHEPLAPRLKHPWEVHEAGLCKLNPADATA